MRTSLLHLGLVTALALPGAVAAQDADQPATLRLSFYHCNLNEVADPLFEQLESVEIRIWDELVDEGMVESYGYFVHAWASEWNVGIYTVAESIEAVLAATEEFINRLEERHPDAENGINQLCPAHRDGFYFFGPRTGMDDDEDGDG